MHDYKGIVLHLLSLTLRHSTGMELTSNSVEFCFESTSPWDAVLLLFLNVLMLHVGDIVQESEEPIHDDLADFTGVSAVINIQLVLNHALVAAKELSLGMEEVTQFLVLGAGLDYSNGF